MKTGGFSLRKKLLAAFVVLILATVAAVAILGGLIMFSDLLMDKYATYDSPDGRFQIVVMRNKQFFGSGPGQAGDAPGEVRLYNKAGNLLEKADVEMVQIVENVEWKKDSVYIKFVADWKLPSD